MEYISKKIPKEYDSILKYVQAHYQLEKGEKVTEADVLAMALEHIAQEKYAYRKKTGKKKLSELFGSVKGGAKSTEEEIDKVVYGPW